MTDFEKYTLAIQIISTLGLGITILYGALQLRANQLVNKQTNDWNKRSAAQAMCIQYEELNPDKTELLNTLKYFQNNGIATKSELASLFNDKPELRLVCHRLLNYFEYLCLGIKQGVYDEQVVKSFWSNVMPRLFIRLKPYIEQHRSEAVATVTVWALMEEYSNKWNNEQISTT